MKCAYCNDPCDDRPVRHEAVCWNCHRKHFASVDQGSATADNEGETP